MVTAGPSAAETGARRSNSNRPGLQGDGDGEGGRAEGAAAEVDGAAAAARHQFSNTKQIEGNQMIHIVNMQTVKAISKAFGADVGWQRFR